MNKNTSVQIRLTKDQKQRILLSMENAGHKTLSGYARSLLLEQDLSASKMLREIHRKVVGGDTIEKGQNSL